ncbi:MAG: tetratricopeptide repeat protein [Opitutales bacterium]
MFLFRRLLCWCAPLAVFALVLGGCSGGIEEEEPINSELLEGASLKLLSGKAEEAIETLEELNKKHPKNTEVMIYLGEARRETGDYLQAAFWYEQVAEMHPNGSRFLQLAGECYEFAGDDESAELTYSAYVARQPDEGHVWHKLYQLRIKASRQPGLTETERKQLETGALNAFLKVRVAVSAKEALDIARIYRKKKILTQAKLMFQTVYDNPNGDKHDALLGLLDVYLARKDDDQSESTINLLNKNFPGALDNFSLNAAVVQLLIKRHPAELGSLDDVEDHTIRDLLAKLQDSLVVAKRSGKTTRKGSDFEPEPEPPKKKVNSLADFFDFNASSEPTEDTIAENPDEPSAVVLDKVADFLQRAEFEYVGGNYQAAQFFLREAIKEDPKNATLWHWRSKVHHLAKEPKEAKMTDTEAVRLAPDDLEIRLHYLEIVRPLLSPDQFLQALEKANDRFPLSPEIVWQLALHYHYLERNYNATAILYRRFLELAPPDDPRRETAQRELDSISQP